MIIRHPSDRVISIPGIGINILHGRVSAADWWDPNGDIGCTIAAYQAKAAASYAASKTDLSGNGNDAYAGSAPTWAAGTGWTFDGIDNGGQYLLTGVTPASGWSMALQFTNLSRDPSDTDVFCGSAGAGNRRFYLGERIDILNAVIYGAGQSVIVLPLTTIGVAINLALSGQQGYRNGAADGGLAGAWDIPNNGIEINIGRHNGSGTESNIVVVAMSIYSCTLTAPQVLAVATAMAAL